MFTGLPCRYDSVMGDIKPHDAKLLTDDDVDYSLFSCCGDEDLVFLRCRICQHIWVECFECSTWFVDLDNLDLRESCFLTSEGMRLKCPSCSTPLSHNSYLSREHCDLYLATRQQVVAAGFARFLSESQRTALRQLANSVNQRAQSLDAQRKWIAVGAAVGAAGWLLGVGLKLISLGLLVDATVPLMAAILIILCGYWIWQRRQSGKPVHLFSVVQTLLAASAALGFISLLFLRARGTLEATIDPKGSYPEWVNFLAPMIILVMMAIVCIPPINRRLTREYL